MTAIRRPAVAGVFYPADAGELHATILAFLNSAESVGPTPKALIVPHAGYLYSGPVAATGYAHLAGARQQIQRVVLLGPAHFIAFDGLAATSADAFATPLGLVPVDRAAISKALAYPQVRILDHAHAREHSLEVQLPFLQVVLGDFSIVPLTVGEAAPTEVGEVLEALWGGPETGIVVSSDLSHYHEYETARRLDEVTSRAIEALRWEEMIEGQACGYHAITGLLRVARQHGLCARTVDLRNSGDTAGPRDQVVGYGAYTFTAPSHQE